MKLIFVEKRKEAGNAFTFIFKPKTRSDLVWNLVWKAGQYLFYTIPNPNPDNRGVTRYFTISSSPSEKFITITTRISDKPGTFKKSLLKLKTGDEIEASGPDGDFTIDNPKRNFVFIAGGIGITPFRSILKQAAHKKQKLNVTLLYANKNEDIVFKEELDLFKSKNPNLKISYFISRRAEPSGRRPNHINNSTIKQFNNSYLFYISGPTSFVKEIREIIKAQGISKENIKTDIFSGYS